MLVRFTTLEGTPTWIDAARVAALSPASAEKDGAPLIGVTALILAGLPPVVLRESMEDVAEKVNAAIGEPAKREPAGFYRRDGF